MFSFYRLLPLLFCLTITAPVCGQVCADASHVYGFSYGGKHYEIIKELKSWDSAAACAVARGGYLAQINSATEQDSIWYAITHGAAVPTGYTSVADGGGIAYVWTGATDKHTEGAWLWDGNNDNAGVNFWNGQGTAGSGTGSAVTGAYNHWGGTTAASANEPDNYGGTQNAAAIALAPWPYGVAGEWNDINAANRLYYVVEYDNATATGEVMTTADNVSLVYPNPAMGTLQISTGRHGQPVRITLSDAAGIIALVSNSATADVTDLPAGFYIAVILMDDGNYVRCALTVTH